MVHWLRSSFVLAALSASLSPVLASQGRMFEAAFANGEAWEALPGVTAEAATLPERGECLHVRGRQEAAWNYTRSPEFALEAGHKYRLSGWVKVVSIRPAIPPYFKVECTGDVPAQLTTNRYDLADEGWQELTAEFEVPQGDHGGWVALEKGTDSPMEIDAYVDEVSVMEIERFTAGDRYRFDTVPEPLARLREAHPRIHLTADRLTALKA